MVPNVRYNGEVYCFEKEDAVLFAVEGEQIRARRDLRGTFVPEVLALAWEVELAHLSLEQAESARTRLLMRARFGPYGGYALRSAVLGLLIGVMGHLAFTPSGNAWGASADLEDVPPPADQITLAAPTPEPDHTSPTQPEAAPVAPTPEPTPVASREASHEPRSLLPIMGVTSSRHYGSHPPERLFDGSLETGWQAKRLRRSDMFIEFDLGAVATIHAIEIANGCQASDPGAGDLFRLNARIREAQLVFDDGAAVSIDLTDDRKGFMRFSITPYETRRLRLEIERFHWGRRWRKDVCISEVRIHGAPALD